MRRTILCGFLLLLVFVAFNNSTAAAAPVIDQSQTSENGGIAFWDDSNIAQTFTPEISGYLDHIVLGLHYSGEPSTAYIQIVDWDTSSPGSTIGQVDDMVTVYGPTLLNTEYDFSDQGVYLESGTMYAILLSNDLVSVTGSESILGADVQWDDNLYLDGALWSNRFGTWDYWPYGDPNTDLQFETYMNPVPVPGAVWLLGAGLIGLVTMRRKINK